MVRLFSGLQEQTLNLKFFSQSGKKKSLKFSEKRKRETSTIPQQLTEQTPSAEEDD